MPRVKSKALHKTTIPTLNEPGRYSDGDGLLLVVRRVKGQEGKNGPAVLVRKTWAVIFRVDGRQKEMWLGEFPDISIAEARDLAADHRRKARSGEDPSAARKKIATPTFGAMADAYLDAHESKWKNIKARAAIRMALERHAKAIRAIPVDKVGVDDVLLVLKPLWTTKPETASRLRGRIELVLDMAKVRGYRAGENPAAWRGNLKLLLPPPVKLSRGHLGAMAYAAIPAFVAELRLRSATSFRALEWTILAASRTSETTGATWGEIDEKGKVWTIPAARMKASRIHRVPLTARMLELLAIMKPARAEGDYIFPGPKRGKPLSYMAMDMALRRLGAKKDGATVHGFRSGFSDWAHNETSVAHETIEECLAHLTGNAVSRAYRRDDGLEKCRKLLESWERYVEQGAASNVIQMPFADAGQEHAQ